MDIPVVTRTPLTWAALFLGVGYSEEEIARVQWECEEFLGVFARQVAESAPDGRITRRYAERAVRSLDYQELFTLAFALVSDTIIIGRASKFDPRIRSGLEMYLMALAGYLKSGYLGETSVLQELRHLVVPLVRAHFGL